MILIQNNIKTGMMPYRFCFCFLHRFSVDVLNVIDICKNFEKHLIKTEIIVASIRISINVTGAAKSGAHIATVPYNVIKQMIEYPLNYS